LRKIELGAGQLGVEQQGFFKGDGRFLGPTRAQQQGASVRMKIGAHVAGFDECRKCQQFGADGVFAAGYFTGKQGGWA